MYTDMYTNYGANEINLFNIFSGVVLKIKSTLAVLRTQVFTRFLKPQSATCGTND